ncbi:MAG: hypothetical protein WBW73_06440 [Rhodoplanes sp.]
MQSNQKNRTTAPQYESRPRTRGDQVRRDCVTPPANNGNGRSRTGSRRTRIGSASSRTGSCIGSRIGSAEL